MLPPAGAQAAKPAAKKPAPINVQKAKAASTQKAPRATSSPKSAGPSIVTRALTILAEEVGMSSGEMTDDLNFADYGVDSLLSLTITGRYREEMGLDLESSVFVINPLSRISSSFFSP